MDTLPHGSGINYDWVVEYKHRKLYCHNKFDTMDEHGYYDSVVPFTLVIDLDSPMEFALKFHGKCHYWVNKYMLRDYLEELFSCWISSNS
jgi:hypothetical protein